MAGLLALLGPIIQGAAQSGLQALGQRSQNKAANSLTQQYMAAEAARQAILQQRYEEVQKPLTKNILGFVQGDPLKMLSGLTDRNLNVGKKIQPEISAALARFGGDYEKQALGSAGKGRQFSLETILNGAQAIGIDPETLSAQMLGMIGGEDAAAGGLRDILSGRAAEDRSYGRSLRDGSFYSTPTGQQATKNLFSAIAPMISSRGLDAYGGSAFAGAPDIGENRGLTAFLRNAEATRAYGDRVLSGSDQLESAAAMQPFQMRDALMGRLGGLLTTGTGFGQNLNQASLGFGTTAANAGAQFGGQYFGSQLQAILGAPEFLGFKTDQTQAALGMSELYADLLKFSLGNSPYNPAFQYGQQQIQSQTPVFGMS